MLLIAIGRILYFIIIFLTVKVSTSLLPPEEMAKVFLVSSIVAFYALFLLNPVGMFMNRRFHAWNSDGKVKRYYGYFWLYLFIVCCVSFASLALFSELEWVDSHALAGWIKLLVVGSLLFTTVNQVVIPGLNLLGYRGWFVSLTFFTAAIGLVVAIFFVLQFSARAESWICGLLVGQLVVSILGWRVFFLKININNTIENPNKTHIKALLDFAWPISIAVGLGWIQAQSYRFFMESMLGLNALGLFAAGYGISAGLISAFESIFTSYLQPLFYRNIVNDDVVQQSKAWGEYSEAILPSLILVGCLIFSVAMELTQVMLGTEYWSSYVFVGWGVVAESARVGAGIYGMVAHARMKTGLLLLPNLLGALVSVSLIWWLMPIYGSNGVGLALMCSSLVIFSMIYFFTRKEYKTVFPYKALIKSFMMGGVVFLLAEGLRQIMIKNLFFSTAEFRLLVVGSVFLLFQYILVKPLLRANGSYR